MQELQPMILDEIVAVLPVALDNLLIYLDKQSVLIVLQVHSMIKVDNQHVLYVLLGDI
jgi:hypothetical protein